MPFTAKLSNQTFAFSNPDILAITVDFLAKR
jgi:hypothetical protein